MKHMKRQSGMTLTELMIGLLIGLIVSLAVTTVFIITLRASTETLSITRLNQEVRATMQLVSSDIRRAGFVQGGGVIAEGGLNIINDSCVLYEYDANRNGVIDNEERFGLREWNGMIQMRSLPNAACDDLNGWTIIAGGIDDQMALTLELERMGFNEDGEQINGDYLCRNTTIDPVGYGNACLVVIEDATVGDQIEEIRMIRVTLAGQLGEQSIVLSEVVKVRNDRRFTFTGAVDEGNGGNGEEGNE